LEVVSQDRRGRFNPYTLAYNRHRKKNQKAEVETYSLWWQYLQTATELLVQQHKSEIKIKQMYAMSVL
jgi:hypothetical protein